MSADHEKLIRIVLQALQNWWESLREYAWVIAGIFLLAATVLSIGLLLWLVRYGSKLLSCDFAVRRRAFECLPPSTRN